MDITLIRTLILIQNTCKTLDVVRPRKAPPLHSIENAEFLSTPKTCSKFTRFLRNVTENISKGIARCKLVKFWYLDGMTAVLVTRLTNCITQYITGHSLNFNWFSQ